MPHINLLPWREELRKEKQRQFISIAVGAAIFSALIVVLIQLEVTGNIALQEGRNKYLQDQIVIVDKEIEEIRTLKQDKKALLARMAIIQELQSSRSEIVHLFDEVARAVPDGIYLLNITRSGTSVILEGVANSNDSISHFMRRLDGSKWMTEPRLLVIDSSKQDYKDSSWFNLQVTQVLTTKQPKE